MTVFTEGRHGPEYLHSEANGDRSRDVVTIESGAGVLKAGTVLGRKTTGGKYVASPDTGADGSQTAIAILYADVDATSADVKATVTSRDAEVKSYALAYAASVNDANKRAAKATQLAAVGIIVR